MMSKVFKFRVRMNRACALLFAMLCQMTLAVHAEEQAIRLRVIGLCSPDREADLRQILGTIPDLQLESLDYDNAEASFRYDVAKVFTNFNPKKPPTPEQIVARLDDLLRNPSQGTFGVAPLSTVPKDKLTLVEIKIGILDCRACRFAAYQAVAKKDGVERATVNSEKGIVTAWIDPSKTDRPALEEALKKARVEVTPKP